MLIGVLVVAVAALLAIAGGAAMFVRATHRQAQADREATLAMAQQILAGERNQTVQAAVDTVLAVAGDKLADHSTAASRELDMRNEAFGKQAEQISSELVRMQQLVAELQRERAEQHGRLEHGLEEALRASTSLAHTTQSLRETLASTHARGQWGERMAEDVLRTAGFIEGVNYRKQATLSGGGRPDFTFQLPRDRVLHMDVKFPLDNYQRAIEADRDQDRSQFEVAFMKDVRQRINEISGRGYIDPDETVEAVLLFIPNESIYGFVHEHDPQLVDHALRQKVVLCSPFTLFAVLAVVRQAVDAFLMERTSDEILRCLGGFNDQWAKFSDAIDKVGKRLDSAQTAFDEMSGPRKRQLQRQLDRIDALREQRGLPSTADDLDGIVGTDDGDREEADRIGYVIDDEPLVVNGNVPSSAGPSAAETTRPDEPRRLRPVRLK